MLDGTGNAFLSTMRHKRGRTLALLLALVAAFSALVGLRTAFAGTPGANIFISELDAVTNTTPNSEFIELYDLGAGNTSLNGLIVVLFDATRPGDISFLTIDLAGQSTNMSGTFLICTAQTSVPNCGVTLPFPGLLPDSPAAVAVYADSATNWPNNSLPTTTNLVDAIVYDTMLGTMTDDALVAALGQTEQVSEDARGMAISDSIQLDPSSIMPVAPLSGALVPGATYYAGIPSPGAMNVPSAITLSGFGATSAALPLSALAIILAGATLLVSWRRRA